MTASAAVHIYPPFRSRAPHYMYELLRTRQGVNEALHSQSDFEAQYSWGMPVISKSPGRLLAGCGMQRLSGVCHYCGVRSTVSIA